MEPKTRLSTHAILLGGLLGALLGPFSAARPQPSGTTAVDFVVGNAEFVLLHELAHLIVGEQQIPIIGSQESAADYVAAMVLLRPPGGAPANADTLLEFVVNTVDGFAIAWQRSEALAKPIPYWDTHALTVQRFATVACLLYGSDPERFAALPGVAGMPAERAHRCPAEFQRAAAAIDWMFATYGRGPGDPPGAPLSIRIEAPPTLTSQRIMDEIQARGTLHTTVARFEELFALQEPVSLVVRSCRQPQAAWLPEQRELVLCYELFDAYYLLSRDQHRSTIQSIFGE